MDITFQPLEGPWAAVPCNVPVPVVPLVLLLVDPVLPELVLPELLLLELLLLDDELLDDELLDDDDEPLLDDDELIELLLLLEDELLEVPDVPLDDAAAENEPPMLPPSVVPPSTKPVEPLEPLADDELPCVPVVLAAPLLVEVAEAVVPVAL